MKFDELIKIIEDTSSRLQKRALTSVNQLLVIRNWLIGCYIVEYEQKGADRSKYGEKLLENLSSELKKKKIKGMSFTNLKIFRQFYLIYPQIIKILSEKKISQPLADKFMNAIYQALPDEFGISISQPPADKSGNSILQPLAEELEKKRTHVKQYIEPALLFTHLSFRHFTELIKVDDALKRAFYENEAIKGNWSSRQLKRQIESLLFERIGLSKNKTQLLKSIEKTKEIVSVEDTIKDPYVLEFTGFKELPAYSESDLESALLDKIQDFLIELGHGFCFEARQKRITIDNEHDRIDLVFYHRILKCHVLIDLKVRAFQHADAGQMNFYLNYYKKNMMAKNDNPPVGIIMCTNKDNAKVEYTTTGIDNKMFVSKYLVELPKKEELEKLIELKD
ncbi:DUF1016 family protein [Candidatus Dependentiae bacterium]|nr:DUF1016 family protein [Candidatus Dependentiae bacterium]